MGGAPGDRPDFRNMTPEEREQAMQRMRSQGTRNALQRAGVTDAATQDAILSYTEAQDKARQPLRDQSRKIADMLQDATATDAQVATELRSFRAAVAAEKLRSTRALADLSTKTGYRTKPRLEALLTMMGVLGDEAAYIGAMPGGMRGGPGGVGGPGGWGGPGGMGGQGAGGRDWGGQGRGGQGGNGQGRRGGGQGRGNRPADGPGNAPAPADDTINPGNSNQQ
jgi:hypothetical protein